MDIWTLGLFLPFGCCEQCCYEQGVQISCRDPSFSSFGYIPRS